MLRRRILRKYEAGNKAYSVRCGEKVFKKNLKYLLTETREMYRIYLKKF